MLDTKHKQRGTRYRNAAKQRGVSAIEFALLALVFFLFVFTVIELARAMYLFNTLQEVTRRAAAMAVNENFDNDTVASIRSRALFKDTSGNLLVGDPITPAHLKIDYRYVDRDSVTHALEMKTVSTLPACPERNRLNCLSDPYSSSCIKFVRVRVCVPGSTDCTAVPYKALIPLFNVTGFVLPRSETIVPVQSLGHSAGTMPCT